MAAALPLLIVLDFDGTITQHDTINIIGQFAATRNGGASGWDDIVTAYLADHARHVAAYRPAKELRTTLEQELNFLESLRPIEEISAERVRASGLFRGVWGVYGDGEGEGEWELGLLSVNWSQAFVEGVLGGNGGGDGENNGGRFTVKRVNRIRWPEGVVEGPAELGGVVMATAQDKLDALRALLVTAAVKGDQGEGTRGVGVQRDGGQTQPQQQQQQQQQGKEQERRVVYIGDSTTDLPCLMEASTGIIMADNNNSTLLKTLDRLGFDVPHVAKWKAPARLAWASDFDEILRSKILE
ncbi:hypothetical protein B0T17DRAFT_511391 [Bombardia bombarda]|uniref:Uncharacterized protein n=1 Tax=Bombardia bombarda TaxID=252184 RepID=A0AA39U7X6_9PEZI|nr:hypothetical protein B0T17DRAFT_511391 [Bombardia bombarda]